MSFTGIGEHLSHVFETRCVSATLADPQGVARVACIGDSMMFGFCAPSRDALPAQLNRILNQACPDNLVFVDSFGETSGNVWDAWPRFKLRAQSMRFDAVVFSVCQNDLDLFATHGASYGRYHLTNFQEDAPQWEAATDLFLDVAAWRKASGIDVLVIFYTFHLTDRPMIDRTKPLMASLGLPFIDMLEYYQKETAVTVDTYRVSEFDGHPSPMAHELAARKIAREFRAGRFLTRAPALGPDVDTAVKSAVQSMVDQGVAPDAALMWSLEIARAKRNSAQRRTVTGIAGRNTVEAWAGVEKQSKESIAALRRQSRRRIRSALVEREWGGHEGYFSNLAAYRRRLEAAVFILIHGRAGETLAAQAMLLPDSALQQGGRPIPFDGDLAALLSQSRARMDKALGAMAIGPSAGQGSTQLLPPGVLDPFARDVGVEGLLADEFHLIDRQISLLEDYASKVEGTISPQAPEYRLLWAIKIDLGSAFVYVDRLIALLESKLPLNAPDGPPWTIVEVTVDGAAGADVKDPTFDLVVELAYAEPRRGIIRDRQLAGAVKERGVYRFEFPLMLEGSVRVRVPQRGVNLELFRSGEARFSAVRIGSADWSMNFAEGGKLVEWAGNDQVCAEVDLSDIVLS